MYQLRLTQFANFNIFTLIMHYLYRLILIPANNIIHVAKINGHVKGGKPRGASNVLKPKCMNAVSTIPKIIAR